MRIAITSSGEDLNSQIDLRFGRCQYYIIIDPDTMDFELISYESSMASHGAGIQAAQTITDKNVSVLITGNVGPNAFQTLQTAGIKIFTGVSGTVREALEQYKNGNLQQAAGSTVGAHTGMGRGRRQGSARECLCHYYKNNGDQKITQNLTNTRRKINENMHTYNW